MLQLKASRKYLYTPRLSGWGEDSRGWTKVLGFNSVGNREPLCNIVIGSGRMWIKMLYPWLWPWYTSVIPKPRLKKYRCPGNIPKDSDSRGTYERGGYKGSMVNM